MNAWINATIDRHPIIWVLITIATVIAVIAAAVYAVDSLVTVQAHAGPPRLPRAGS